MSVKEVGKQAQEVARVEIFNRALQGLEMLATKDVAYIPEQKSTSYAIGEDFKTSKNLLASVERYCSATP